MKALSSSITKLTEVANKAVLTQKQEKQQQQQQQQQQHPDRRKGVKQFAEDQAGEKTEKKQQALALHKAALKQKADALRKEVRVEAGVVA